MKAARSLSRAAALGLTLGLVLGAVFLATQSLRAVLAPPGCAELSFRECALLRGSARELAGLQAAAALALALLAAGLASWLRRRTAPKR